MYYVLELRLPNGQWQMMMNYSVHSLPAIREFIAAQKAFGFTYRVRLD